MTDSARTEEIRARVAFYPPGSNCDYCYGSEHYAEDVPYLLAELTALREEVERLRAGLKQLDAAAGEVIAMEEMRYAGTPLTVEPWIDRLADAVHIARRAVLSPSPAPVPKRDSPTPK